MGKILQRHWFGPFKIFPIGVARSNESDFDDLRTDLKWPSFQDGNHLLRRFSIYFVPGIKSRHMSDLTSFQALITNLRNMSVVTFLPRKIDSLSHCSTLRFIQAHKLSIGLKSGELTGHLSGRRKRILLKHFIGLSDLSRISLGGHPERRAGVKDPWFRSRCTYW